MSMLFKRIKDWATSISAFRTGDVIPVDGQSGTAKMPKDDLLRETAQNALAGNVAPEFVPNSTTTVEGQLYIYGGLLYVAKEAYQGPWNSSKFEIAPLSNLFAQKGYAAKTPFELGVKGGDIGYLTAETGGLNRSILTNRAIFGYIRCGKGTAFDIDVIGKYLSCNISGFCVVTYDDSTGAYIETLGDIIHNLSTITLSYDCICIVIVNTDAEDVTSELSAVGSCVLVRHIEPANTLETLESNLEQGNINSDGNPSTATTRVRSTDFVLLGKGSVIYNLNISQQYGVFKYSAVDQTFVEAFATFRQLPCYQLDNDYYIKVTSANDAGGDILAASVAFACSPKVPQSSPFKPYKTPFELGVVGGDYGAVTNTTGTINHNLNTHIALYGYIHCGKGTVVNVAKGKVNVLGADVFLYDDKTGSYKSTIGNINSPASVRLSITEDSIVIIRVKTDKDDVSSYLSDLEKQVTINYVSPKYPFSYLPSELEQGSFGTHGEPVVSAIRVRTSDFVLMGKGSRIFVPNTHIQYGVLLYSLKNKGWFYSFSAWRNLPGFQLDEDAFVKIHCAGDGGAAIAADDVKFLAVINEVNDEKLPSYYYIDDYIKGVVAKINGHDADCGFAGDSFVFVTDTHWPSNAGKSPALIDYIKANTTIRNVVFGGDAVTSYDTKDEAKAAYDTYRDVMYMAKYYGWRPVIGNHEFNNPGVSAAKLGETLTAAEAYALVVKENEQIINVIDEYAYYIDNKQAKIRYVFVGCGYTSGIPVSVSNDVVANLDTLPEDYQVMVISHVGMPTASLTIDSTLQAIVDKLDAMQVNNSVIGLLSGHRHIDGNLVTEAGTNIIATTCDAMIEAAGGLTRTRGTITEQAFDVVQIDKTNRKIYLTRVGAGEDREFDY